MPDDWPDDDVLLMLVKESAEHKRAWALIAGLSKTVLKERKPPPTSTRHMAKATGPKPGGYNEKIHELETKIIKQKRYLREVEECRAWEMETERLLVDALERIYSRDGDGTDAGEMARLSLAVHAKRRGPRSDG